MKNPVQWFEIYVDDMERAKRFYEGVFATTLTKIDSVTYNMLGFPHDEASYGCTGALIKMDGVAPGAGGTIVYFGSEDCAVEEQRVSQLGGKIQQPKMAIGQYGFITLAIDTENNVFGIHSMR